MTVRDSEPNAMRPKIQRRHPSKDRARPNTTQSYIQPSSTLGSFAHKQSKHSRKTSNTIGDLAGIVANTVIKMFKPPEPEVDQDATQEEILPTEHNADWGTGKVHPAKIADKDWQDPYKL